MKSNSDKYIPKKIGEKKLHLILFKTYLDPSQ